MRRGDRFVFVAIIAAVTLSLAGCGGSSEPESTPTPEPSPTPDQVEVFRNEIQERVPRLLEDLDTLEADLQAAEESQADPKWPQVLTADFMLIANGANELLEFDAPNQAYEPFKQQLDQGLERILAGTQLLGQAILQREEAAGQQAYAALNEGRQLLDDAMVLLPAE